MTKINLEDLAAAIQYITSDTRDYSVKLEVTQLNDLVITYHDNYDKEVRIELTGEDSPYTSKITRTEDLRSVIKSNKG